LAEDESGWQAAPRVPVGYSDNRSLRPHVECRSSKTEPRAGLPVDDGWLVANKRGKKVKEEPHGSSPQVHIPKSATHNKHQVSAAKYDKHTYGRQSFAHESTASREGDWFLAMKGLALTAIDKRKSSEELKKKLHIITELEYLEAKGDILNDNQQALLASYVFAN